MKTCSAAVVLAMLHLVCPVMAQTPYRIWAASHGLSGAAADLDRDPDGDGLTNAGEYALNSHPNSSSSAGDLSVHLTSRGVPFLRIDVRAPSAVDTGFGSLEATPMSPSVVKVQRSVDGVSWDTIGTFRNGSFESARGIVHPYPFTDPFNPEDPFSFFRNDHDSNQIQTWPPLTVTTWISRPLTETRAFYRLEIEVRDE